MLIGVPKEIKNHEYRVSISPTGVKELVYHGHQVIVETNAAKAIGFTDEQYQAAGALVIGSAADVYAKADMIVKVKEPQLSECSMLRDGQILFCYLHLAANERLTNMLMDSSCIAIAYETITSDTKMLPLLAPMSEVAGRVAVQAGMHCLEKSNGGRGVLLSGAPGVSPGKVVILGGGVVGTNAALISAGMGAEVVILERSISRIRELEWRFQGKLQAVYATAAAIEEYVEKADLLIGAILNPGGTAPTLVSEDLVKRMQDGSVIIDVAIDQGGCVETSKPTTHENPTFVEHGIIHYGVTNMPSAVSYTATRALENVTLPYITALADKGYRGAMRNDEHFKNGLNIYRGRITHEAVAGALNHAYTPPKSFLGE